MALPDLAAAADLTARGITPTAVHTVMLAVASSVVRGAAGSPILENDSTIVLSGIDRDVWLDLPGQPVTAVTAVERDGVTLTADQFKLANGRLWGSTPWGDGCEPVDVEIDLTHGLPTVPPYIVQLVCDLAIAGANAATAGAHDPNVIAEKIDDYSVTFAPGTEAVASAVELPQLTRRALRARFGGGTAVVTYR